MSITTKETKLIEVTVTIANTGTLSDAVEIGNGTIVGAYFPASMDGDSVTIHDSSTLTGTYTAVYDSTNTAVGWTVDTNAGVRTIQPASTAGIRPFVKLACSAQTGSKTVVLLIKAIR